MSIDRLTQRRGRPHNQVKHAAAATVPAVSTDLPVPREHGLMLFHVPESEDENPQLRYQHDLNFLQELVDKLLDLTKTGISVRRILRLGKRSTGSVRPIRVVFNDDKSPKLILSRLWRLKGTRVHIRADLEPEARLLLKGAITELRSCMQAGETGLRIVNFRVVTRGRLINRPITLVSRVQNHQVACA